MTMSRAEGLEEPRRQRGVGAVTYFVARNPTESGEHEVHVSGCGHLPAPGDRISLGTFGTCRDAMREAMRHYPRVDGCPWCSRECHSRGQLPLR